MYDFLGILVEFVLPRMREFSVLGEMRYGMLGVVEKLSRGGGDASGAVLVRELARACCVEPLDCDSVIGAGSLLSQSKIIAPKQLRRAASEASPATPLRLRVGNATYTLNLNEL